MDDNNKVNSEGIKEPNNTTATQRRTRANTIDLVDLCYMLLGHWWQIVLCVLLHKAFLTRIDQELPVIGRTPKRKAVVSNPVGDVRIKQNLLRKVFVKNTDNPL